VISPFFCPIYVVLGQLAQEKNGKYQYDSCDLHHIVNFAWSIR